MASPVALIAHHGYDPELLESALSRAIAFAGFDLANARGRRVLLKPNMLGAYPPEMGITTHPAFVAAAARIFAKVGATVSVGDSPNGIHPIERVWRVTGLGESCRIAGAERVSFEASGSVERLGLRIARAVAEADLLVNLPKLKTHGLTILTLGAKNLFGCINGMQKAAHHRDAKDPKRFADVVARAAEASRPALTLVDGIVAMEGDGPSAGDLVPLGVIAAGRDVHAVDAACCALVGLEPSELETLEAAREQGFWDGAKPELAGDPLGSLKPARFKFPATYTRGMRDWWISRLVLGWIWSGVHATPRIVSSRCTRCLMCVDGCPVSAIPRPAEGAVPLIRDEVCIQCFCCHELCASRAIELRRSLPVRFVSRLADARIRMRHLRGGTP